MAVSVHGLGEHHLTENLQAFVQHGDDKNSDARSKKLCNLQYKQDFRVSHLKKWSMGTYKRYGFETRCLLVVVVVVVVVGDTYLPRYWWSIRKIKLLQLNSDRSTSVMIFKSIQLINK